MKTSTSAQLKKTKSVSEESTSKRSKPVKSAATLVSTSSVSEKAAAEEESEDMPNETTEELLQRCHDKSKLTDTATMLFAEESTVEEVLSRKVKTLKHEFKLKAELSTKLNSDFRALLKDNVMRQKKFASEAIEVESNLIELNDDLSEKYEQAASECTDLRNQIQCLSEEKYLIEKDLVATKANYDQAVERVVALESLMEQKNHQLEEANKNKEVMERDINSFLSQCDELKQENDSLNLKLEDNAQSHQLELETAKSQLVSKFTAEIQELNDQLTKWAIQGSEQTSRIDELNQNHLKLTETIKSLEGKLAEKESALITAINKISEISNFSDILEVKVIACFILITFICDPFIVNYPKHTHTN
jgi:hypothetical protein